MSALKVKRVDFHFSISKTDKSKAYQQIINRPQDSITGSIGKWELQITDVCTFISPLSSTVTALQSCSVFCCCIRKTTGQPPFNLIYRLNPFSRSHQHNRTSRFWQVLMSITHVTVSTFPYIYICTTTFKTFNTKLYIT